MYWTPSEGDTIAGPDNQYELVEYVDTGGFTTVYRANDTDTGREFCIKYPYFGTQNEDIAAFVTREVAALRTVEALGGNPNIMTLNEHFIERGTDFLVVEYVDGEVVSNLTETFEPAAARKILLSVCSAIGQLHTNDIIYRDLKEDNLIITPDDQPILIDLNTCRTIPVCPSCETPIAYETANSSHCGACNSDLREMTHVLDRDRGRYKAPEQRDTDRPTGPWTDVYALGRLLFRLIAGFVPPREFDPSEHIEGATYLLECIRRAIDPNPEHRYRNALEFGDALYLRDSDPGQPTARLIDVGTDSEYDISPGARLGNVDAHNEPMIPIEDDGRRLISREHASFVTDKRRWQLLDTSLNGTLIQRGEETYRILGRQGQYTHSLVPNPTVPERRFLAPGDVVIPVSEQFDNQYRFLGRPWVKF